MEGPDPFVQKAPTRTGNTREGRGPRGEPPSGAAPRLPSARPEAAGHLGLQATLVLQRKALEGETCYSPNAKLNKRRTGRERGVSDVQSSSTLLFAGTSAQTKSAPRRGRTTWRVAGCAGRKLERGPLPGQAAVVAELAARQPRAAAGRGKASRRAGLQLPSKRPTSNKNSDSGGAGTVLIAGAGCRKPRLERP